MFVIIGATKYCAYCDTPATHYYRDDANEAPDETPVPMYCEKHAQERVDFLNKYDKRYMLETKNVGS